MDKSELRAAQAPLKQQYRDNPQSALTPVHATGDFRDEGITATVKTFAGPTRAGCTVPPVEAVTTPAVGTC